MTRGGSARSYKLARLSVTWKRSPFDWDDDYEYQHRVGLRFSAVLDLAMTTSRSPRDQITPAAVRLDEAVTSNLRNGPSAPFMSTVTGPTRSATRTVESRVFLCLLEDRDDLFLITRSRY